VIDAYIIKLSACDVTSGNVIVS